MNAARVPGWSRGDDAVDGMTEQPTSKRFVPEEWAALVNAFVVMSVPSAFKVYAWLEARAHPRATVSAVPAPDSLISTLAALAVPFGLFLPVAALVAWRTHAHAKRVRNAGDTGWRGVFEAMAVGATLPIIFMVSLMVRIDPLGAAAYGGAYLLIGVAIGGAIGLVLRAFALIVLRLRPS